MADRDLVLAELARAVVARPAAVRVAVDGRTASGKTRLADELAPLVAARGRSVTRLSADDFHRSEAERFARGRESAEGYYRDGFDHDAIRRAVAEARADVVLVDGVFLLRPELDDLWDLRIWLEVDEAESLRRGVARDAARMEDARRRYERRYLPGERLYVAEARPLERADVVVDMSDPRCPRLRR